MHYGRGGLYSMYSIPSFIELLIFACKEVKEMGMGIYLDSLSHMWHTQVYGNDLAKQCLYICDDVVVTRPF